MPQSYEINSGNTPVLYDGVFDIAVGLSRKETNWKNKEIAWSVLAEKLRHTHRTPETHTQYIALKKDRQDEIKDVGGFVGGCINGGRRLKGSVLHRQLITLDIDFAPVDFWQDFTLLYGNAAVLYSTHKHSPDSPRLRLIIPLSRAVAPDEYEAIARRVAGMIEINYFDPTTFETNRLMYWPSTSANGEYVYQIQDGVFLDADKVLASYRDWRDISQWPEAEQSKRDRAKTMSDKQQDPLLKDGIVGAFCRAYDIHAAIETFLPDVYSPTNDPNRYTYSEGSTAGGLVVYEDKFAFSHHSSDPISMKLCNAFDLVRLHKYGERDTDASKFTPMAKKPSYVAMCELAAEDVAVKRELKENRLKNAEAKEDFKNPETGETIIIDTAWMEALTVDGKGNILGTLDNAVAILKNDFRLTGIAFDAFQQREVITADLPWRSLKTGVHMVDSDIPNLKYFVMTAPEYEVTLSTPVLNDAVQVLYTARSVNNVRKYLDGLTWDGTPRLDKLLVNYLGAEDHPYTHAVTCKPFLAAVARIYNPGTKFDHMLTFVGPEGIGKSTLISKMGKQWFSDTFNFGMLKSKEALEQLQGGWLIEVGEMSGLDGAEVEAAKRFITSCEDRYRVSYGKRVSFFPRQCVLFGSTNKPEFLKKSNGNRRFWPVDVGLHVTEKKPWDLQDNDVNQLWAEACARYQAGESLLLPEALANYSKRMQQQHEQDNGLKGVIMAFLERPVTNDWNDRTIDERAQICKYSDDTIASTVRRDRISAIEIWVECLGRTRGTITNFGSAEIHTVLCELKGWKLHIGKLRQGPYGMQKTYVREDAMKQEIDL